MGLLEIENLGKRVFERYPIIKRVSKRVYHRLSYALDNDKFKSKGDFTRVSPENNNDYYFGYYDKSPYDQSDRFVLALKSVETTSNPAPSHSADIVVIDTTDSTEKIIGCTNAWNTQQGCMLQWLGNDFGSRVIYNDFRNNQFCSVIYNLEVDKEESVLPVPVYDVAKNGEFALSLDFSRLHWLRPGYGYSNNFANIEQIDKPSGVCISKLNLVSGENEEIISYEDLYNLNPTESMLTSQHKVNHIMINPDGTRFMFLHRWYHKGKKNSRLVTSDIDGTNLFVLSDDTFVSHCCWKNNNTILGFMRKENFGDHYYKLTDFSEEFELLWPELNTDGHCSYSPDLTRVVTDTYPNRKRKASLYICSDESKNEAVPEKIGIVFSAFKYDNDVRCDLHPRWNRKGDRIIIDSTHEGRRGIYEIKVD